MRRLRTPSSNYGAYRKLFLGIFAVGAILVMARHSKAPSSTEDTPAAVQSAETAVPSKDSPDSNLRGSSSSSDADTDTTLQQQVVATNENGVAEEKSKFEQEMEQEEADREHLDGTIAVVKDEMTTKEDDMIMTVEGKLEVQMQKSKEQLKVIMDEFLVSEKNNETKIHEIEEKVSSLVDEKVRYDLFQAAEDITIQKSNEIDQVVLEDVVKGMKSSDIEKDVEELETNLMEDLTSEISEAEHQIELKLNETVRIIEQEVIKETLGIDVDLKDLSVPKNIVTSESIQDNEENEVEKEESMEVKAEENSTDNEDESDGSGGSGKSADEGDANGSDESADGGADGNSEITDAGDAVDQSKKESKEDLDED